MKKLFTLLLALMLFVCTAAAAEPLPADGIRLTQFHFGITPNVFDVDGDGVKEDLYFGFAGNTQYYYVQFLPAGQFTSLSDDDMHGIYACMHRLPYLYVLEKYWLCDNTDPELGPTHDDLFFSNLDLTSLCFLRNASGELYAAESCIIFGANGMPDEYIVFYQLTENKLEMQQLDIDVNALLPDEYDGLWMIDQAKGLDCRFEPQLNDWCFAIVQCGIDRNDRPAYLLDACITFEDGVISRTEYVPAK